MYADTFMIEWGATCSNSEQARDFWGFGLATTGSFSRRTTALVYQKVACVTWFFLDVATVN